MALTKKQKQERVAQYVDLLKRSHGVVLAEFGGLAMPGMNVLRGRIREANGEIHVIKNTLAEIALKEAGLPLSGEKLNGSTLMAFGLEEVVGIAKAVVDSAKESEFVTVKGGLLGQTLLSAEEIIRLAALPPLPSIRAQLAGLLNAPAGKVATLLGTPARNVVGVCKAFAEKPAAA